MSREATRSDTSRDSGRAANLGDVAREAKGNFEELTGMAVQAISGAAREGDGWRLSFEVLELARIPDSTSLLGSYDVMADADGGIVEYGRRRRYYRNRADEEDGW